MKFSFNCSQIAQGEGSEHVFPWSEVDSSQVEARGFINKQFKFELDRARILDLLTGHTLYNNSLVAIREILQNSLDAVRLYRHLNPTGYEGRVLVEWNSSQRKLTITDNGTGMTQNTIENHLLKVGSSYYQSPQFREKNPGFSSISRFGIGVLSIFMISDEVEFVTVHPDEEEARILTLPSVQHRYLIKMLPKDNDLLKGLSGHGTRVTLTVRASATLDDIEDLVRFWIVIPGCEVKVKVDEEEWVDVGFEDVGDALSYYLRMMGQDEDKSYSTKVVHKKRDDIEISYCLRHGKYFDSWDFLRRDDDRIRRNSNRARSRMIHLVSPGMCVEGIRIDSRVPGFSDGGPWVIANITGSSSPRTNVARSEIEKNADLEKSIKSIYEILTEHPLSEFNRLVSEGAGLLKASREADWVCSVGLMSSNLLYSDIFQGCMDKIPIYAVEDIDSCQVMSKSEIKCSEKMWTVDSPLLEHIEGIIRSLNVTMTAGNIIGKVAGSSAYNLPFPRLLGRSLLPLEGMEMDQVIIDKEEQRIDVCWKRSNGRWLNFSEVREIFERSSRIRALDSYYEDQFIINVREKFRFMSMALDSKIYSGDPDVSVIEWRNKVFIFPNSPIFKLYEIFGISEDFVYWSFLLLQRRKIDAEKSIILRDSLSDMKLDSDEIVPKMYLPLESLFSLNKFSRGSFYF